MNEIPHLHWPIRVDRGTYATCQQDSDDEAAANVAVLCCFRRGERAESLDFGITDPTFEQMPIDTAEIERQAAIYEPRAELDIAVTDAPTGVETVRIAVRIATTEEER